MERNVFFFKLLKNYLFPAILVSLCFLTLVIFINSFLVNESKKNVDASLSEYFSNIDSEMRSFNYSTLKSTAYEDMLTVSRLINTDRFVFALKAASESYYKTVPVNQFSFRDFICFSDLGIILTDNSAAFVKSKEFYLANINLLGLTDTEFFEKVKNCEDFLTVFPTALSIDSDKNEIRVIPLIYSPKQGSDLKHIVLLDVQKLIAEAGRLFPGYEIGFKIYHGYDILFNNENMNDAGNYPFWYQHELESVRLTFEIGISHVLIRDMSNRIFPFLIALLVIPALVLFIFAYFQTLKVSNPFYEISQIIHSRGLNNNSVFETVVSEVKELAESREELQNTGAILHKAALDNFMRCLILGRCSKEDIEKMCSHLSVNLNWQNYCVAVFQLRGAEAWQDMSLAVPAGLCGENKCLTLVEKDKSYLLFEAGEPEQAVACKELIFNHMLGSLPHISSTLNCGFGKCVFTVEDIYDSFLTACSALSSGVMQGIPFSVYIEEKSPLICCYYPLDIEILLAEAISGGDSVTAVKIWNGIYEQNFKNKPFQVQDLINFVSQIRYTLIRLQSQFQYPELYPSALFERADTPQKLDTAILTAINAVCGWLNENRSNADDIFKQKIADYIKSNLGCSYFSLSSVASYFGFSENYFSLLFKNMFGKKFVDYIVMSKIDMAKNLLENSNLPISEIAAKVGYNSENSFYRAFKNITNNTPGLYRDTHKTASNT